MKMHNQDGEEYGRGKGVLLATVLLIIGVVVSLILVHSSRFNAFLGADGAFSGDSAAGISYSSGEEQHDVEISPDLFADFEEPVLQEAQLKSKLDVCEIPVSVVVLNTKEGVFDIDPLKKSQVIQYSGTAYYMVDLENLQASDIETDRDANTVTITVPDPVLDHVDIDSSKTEVLQQKNGILAFGKIEMTVEESSRLETEARNKMTQRLEEANVMDQARNFAGLAVQGIFEPVIRGVASDYSLVVRLQSEVN